VELALGERPPVHERLDEQLGQVIHEFLISYLRDEPQVPDSDVGVS
jgi:hypothetical protein